MNPKAMRPPTVGDAYILRRTNVEGPVIVKHVFTGRDERIYVHHTRTERDPGLSQCTAETFNLLFRKCKKDPVETERDSLLEELDYHRKMGIYL
jgi:hypothetical protein